MTGETRSEWLQRAGRAIDDMAAERELAPMSDAQAHRLKALCWQLGEHFDKSLTAAQAERRIAELQARS